MNEAVIAEIYGDVADIAVGVVPEEYEIAPYEFFLSIDAIPAGVLGVARGRKTPYIDADLP